MAWLRYTVHNLRYEVRGGAWETGMGEGMQGPSKLTTGDGRDAQNRWDSRRRAALWRHCFGAKGSLERAEKPWLAKRRLPCIWFTTVAQPRSSTRLVRASRMQIASAWGRMTSAAAASRERAESFCGLPSILAHALPGRVACGSSARTHRSDTDVALPLEKRSLARSQQQWRRPASRCLPRCARGAALGVTT